MMRYLRGTMLACAATMLLSASTATADEWNHKTIVTINQPLVVPGATLAPGTYVFTLADENGSRTFVNIFTENGELVTTAKAIRMQRNDDTRDLRLAVAMAEGAMPMMRGWYYPGSNDGHEFLYPRAQARMMANAETAEIPVTPRG